MHCNVDRLKFKSLVERIRKSSSGDTLIIGTHDDDLNLQVSSTEENHTAILLADIEEDGCVSIPMSVVRSVVTLSGETLTISTEGDKITFQTSTGSITEDFQEASWASPPGEPQVVATLDARALASMLAVSKNTVARKGEKAHEGLLEGALVVSGAQGRFITSNRFSLWDFTFDAALDEDDEPVLTSFSPAQMHASISAIKGDVEMVRIGSMIGFKSDSLTSLRSVQTAGRALDLIPVVKQIRQAGEGDFHPVSVVSKQIVPMLDSHFRSNHYTRLTFSDGMISLSPETSLLAPPNGAGATFSVACNGSSPLGSVLMNPAHALKVIKGLPGEQVTFHIPGEHNRPLGITTAGASLADEPLGLIMPIKRG